MVTARMAPYLLLGFAVAGVLSVWMKPAWLEQHLGGRGWKPVVKASLLGVPLPLCSCGVIPVAVSLRRHGAGKPATVSFLASTPQTGVDSVLATAALLGPVFAGVRVVTALVSGLLAGAFAGVDPGAEAAVDLQKAPAQVSSSRWRSGVTYAMVTLPGSIASSVLLGLVLAGLVSALLPEGALGDWVSAPWAGYLVALSIGLPIYVCSTGSIPLAFALMQGGLSAGAALVFLVSGPATNTATLTTAWKELGPRVTLSYLGALICMALVAGILMDVFGLSLPQQAFGPMAHHMPWGYHVSGVLLLLVLVIAKWGHAEHEAHEETPDVILNVSGMTCTHCEQSVRETVEAHEGLSAVVDRPSGTVRIYGAHADAPRLIEDLANAGFDSTYTV